VDQPALGNFRPIAPPQFSFVQTGICQGRQDDYLLAKETEDTMKDTNSITGWHAHIYFDAATKGEARALCEGAAERFGVAMGRMHDGPVGPHPMGSCQLSVSPGVFGEIIPWLALNRGELTVFAHAESGDHLADHTGHVVWLGQSLPLDLSIF
jgi:aromatic ring-cleaving dioxygenase